MNKFFLDLWHDLRRKHLLPVALLLVAALIAVPLVLKKSSSGAAEPSTPATSSSSSSSADSKPVVVAATDTSTTSKLSAFASKSPFKPHLPKVKSAGTTGSSGAASTGTTGSSGSTSGGGSSNSNSGGSTGTGNSNGGSNTQTNKGPYAYVVNVKFGKRDSTKTYHNVQKLDVLPNSNNPLLVFMGVNTAGDTAVFLTDTSLKASGEGDCKPSADVCSFLYLKLDKSSDTEDLLAQNSDGTGVEYTLKLLDIKKVPVSELTKASKATKAAKKRAAEEAKRLRHTPRTPFHLLFTLPQLPDEVSG
jgi:hypothetical protein